MNFLCTLILDLFHGDLQLKNLRKVTRELGENITDEQLEAMIDECRPLKLLEYCPLFYQTIFTQDPMRGQYYDRFRCRSLSGEKKIFS